MKNLWKGVPALLLLASVGVFLPTGCVDAEAMFVVRSVKAQACETVTVDGPFLFQGAMDVRYSCGYSAVLELGNQLVRRGDETKLQLETSRISVTSVDVQDVVFEADGSETVISEFTYPTTGFIDPSNGTTPGRGLAGALLVDGVAAQAMIERGGGLIVTRSVVRGRTLGGDDIETRPFEFPISVCVGCLCVEPSNDSCVNSTSLPADLCFFPQDQTFDCRWLNGHSCSEAAVCGDF